MADVLALREALHDALCDFGKPHGCPAYDALDRYAAAVRAEAQAIAWAEHSLERNEAVADLFRLLPDSMFPESFAALMERVVAIETIAAASALTARIGGSDHNAEFRALAAKFDGHRCRTGEHR